MTADQEPRLGRYTVLGKLAQGGMAEVFLARHDGPQGFARTVVIKRILPSFSRDPAFLQMFLNEARLAALINHPNVVSIIELGEEPETGSYFIVMEYIEGRDVKSVAKSNSERGARFPMELAVRVVAEASAGLHFAHELKGEDGAPLNLVHRDISLDNLLITYSGLVKVVDFGIAKAAQGERLTKAGQIKGKVSYMSPETILGKAVDRRADVWALGVTLYTLLNNGGRPFQGAGVKAMEVVLNEEPAPIADVDPSLWAIVARALCKDLDGRYQTARALQNDLEAYLASTGRAVTSSMLEAFMAELFPASTDPSRVSLRALGRKPSQPEQRAATPAALPPATTATPVHAEHEARTNTVETDARQLGRRTAAPRAAFRWVLVAGLAALCVGGAWAMVRGTGAAPADAPPSQAPQEVEPTAPVAAAVPAAPRDAVAAPPGPTPPAARPVAIAVAPHPRARPRPAPTPAERAPEAAPVAPPPPPVEAAVRQRGPPGTLAVKVAPWAVVYLDGRQLGTTPFEPVDVPSGPHKLKLVNEDLGVSREVGVEVRPHETTTVRVKLTDGT